MPAKLRLIASPAAVADLREIHEYSCTKWGTHKAKRYLESLSCSMEQLKTHPNLGISRRELHQEIRSLQVAEHLIMYRIKNKCVEIARVLHHRQDFKHQII